jgi:hypothetical protein
MKPRSNKGKEHSPVADNPRFTTWLQLRQAWATLESRVREIGLFPDGGEAAATTAAVSAVVVTAQQFTSTFGRARARAC